VLRAIAEKDDLHISPSRSDGTTYGTATWIWSVAVGNDLYVRPYNGRDSRWFKAAMSQCAGRIKAAAIDYEVTFEKADDTVNGLVDSAYAAKYHEIPYLPSMLTEHTRATTVRVSPR
jgi:hypothetical protein